MYKKIFGVLGLCLVLLVAASGCGGNNDANKIDREVGVSAVVALADSHISSYANGLDTLAMTQEVQSGNWGNMSSLLSNFEKSQVPGTIWFVLPDGSYFTVDKGKTDSNLSDRAYFPGLMAGNKVLGDVVISKSTGIKSLIAASPVQKDGKVIGGLGVSIFLDELSKTLAKELALPENMVFYATTKTGEVVLHSDTQLIVATNPGLAGDVEYKTSELTGWRFALGFKDQVGDISEKRRRSLRLKDYDYSQAGAYFVTICTHKLQPFFGELKDDRMVLNGFGQIVQEEWDKLNGRFWEIETDAFVIMPNHVHGIIDRRGNS